jgi:hypothetical protein
MLSEIVFFMGFMTTYLTIKNTHSHNFIYLLSIYKKMPKFKRIKCQINYTKNPKNQVCGKKCARAARSCHRVLTRVRPKTKFSIFHFFFKNSKIADYQDYQDYK